MELRNSLSDRDRAVYAWQLDVEGFGETGQLKLRNTAALVTRIGGLGGPIALQLAAAGIGKLILAHGGDLVPSDFNRQIIMRFEDLGKRRVDSAATTLRAFNPDLEIETVSSHVTEENVAGLVGRADIVFDAAPRFSERFWLNRACVEQEKPMIDAAMYGMQGQVTTIIPRRTACLACLYPEEPVHWKRRFPVIGAVSATVGNLAVIEGIKLLTGLGDSKNLGMIVIDTLTMQLRRIALVRRENCSICR